MTRSECAAWLLERDHFCILTHARPDGDTLGSAGALCLILRQLGKTAHVLENPEASPFLMNCQRGLSKCESEDGDTLVSVDVATVHLLPETAQPLADRIALRIDHHASATSFAELELVDAGAAACGEIVYDLLAAMGAEMTKEIAWRLYVAVSTDTGCFRYQNTSAHTYRVAAACAESGADLYPITQELFDTTSISELKLQNWMVEHATFLCDGAAAVCAIPKALEENVTREDLEGISGFLRSIEGVNIAATIRQIEDGCKVSVRAVPGYDAAAVCSHFGGGGHKGAAGATLNMSQQEAVRLITAALEDCIAQKQRG